MRRRPTCPRYRLSASPSIPNQFGPKSEQPSVRPTIGPLQQCPGVVDLASVVKVVPDHDADDVAGRETVAPVGEALVVEFSVLVQRADGCEPALVTFAQPLQQLAMRA